MTDVPPRAAEGPVQSPLDRETLAVHFDGYDLEPVITVALRQVTLVDRQQEAGSS